MSEAKSWWIIEELRVSTIDGRMYEYWYPSESQPTEGAAEYRLEELEGVGINARIRGWYRSTPAPAKDDLFPKPRKHHLASVSEAHGQMHTCEHVQTRCKNLCHHAHPHLPVVQEESRHLCWDSSPCQRVGILVKCVSICDVTVSGAREEGETK